jgi:hypothetical protein
LTPYQISLTLRALCAEMLALWELSQPKGRKALRRVTLSKGESAKPLALRQAAALLCLGVLGRYVESFGLCSQTIRT